MNSILIFLVVGLALTWVLEIYIVRKAKQEREEFNAIGEEIISAFQQARTVINVNATSLRDTQGVVDRHNKQIVLMGTLVDLITTALNISPQVREVLDDNNTHVTTAVKGLIDDDEQDGLEES